MALPQQVIDRLSQEPPKTPGWSSGLLLFSGGIFALALVVYFGLTLGYEPYINNQIASTNTQIDTLAKSISTGDQANIITFYSEITNVKSVLANHVLFSNFFTWLQKDTEANVYYTHATFSSVNQVSMGGNAATEADVNQQMAIFEADPQIKSVNLSNVAFSAGTGLWQFSVSIVIDPTLLRASAQ